MQTDLLDGRRRIVAMTILGCLSIAAAPASILAQDCQSAASSSSSVQAPTSVSAPLPLPAAFAREPTFLTDAITYIDKFRDGRAPAKNGFYPELSNMVTGSGWVSAGPGYRHFFSDGRLLVDGSAALSWHSYKMVQGRFEMPKLASEHLVVGVQAMWRDETQVSYFGVGSDPTEDDRSQYRMKAADVVAYATVQANDWLAFGGEYGWLKHPKVLTPGGTFRGDFPATQDLYPSDPGVGLQSQPNFTHREASVVADTRDHHGHPTRGFVYRAALASYSDQSSGLFSFVQYEVEGVQVVPLIDRRWVLAFHGWTVHSDVAPGHEIPFYLIPTLGGHNTLRDFANFQFHDSNILVVNGESRFALFQHADAALFFDAGNVAPRFGDLNLDKTSYGAGLRLHTHGTTFARADVAYGPQGWRFVFRTSEPFRMLRVRRKVADVPFLP